MIRRIFSGYLVLCLLLSPTVQAEGQAAASPARHGSPPILDYARFASRIRANFLSGGVSGAELNEALSTLERLDPGHADIGLVNAALSDVARAYFGPEARMSPAQIAELESKSADELARPQARDLARYKALLDERFQRYVPEQDRPAVSAYVAGIARAKAEIARARAEQSLADAGVIASGLAPGAREARIAKLLEALGQPAGSWQTVRAELTLARLHYLPQTIRHSGWTDSHGQPVTSDLFGNYPAWIYELRHGPTGRRVYIGPNDAATLFQDAPGHMEQVSQLRKTKEAEISAGRENLRRLQRLEMLLALPPEQVVWQWPDHRRLGDPELAQVEAGAKQLEQLWISRISGLSMEEGAQVLTELEHVLATFGPRRGRTTILTPEESDKLGRLLGQLQTGGSFSAADREFLLQIHKFLLMRQTELSRQAGSWGRRRPTAYDLENMRKAPAYHANLEIAAWLLDQFIKNPSWQPFILDAGANISMIYRTLGELLHAHRAAARSEADKATPGGSEAEPNGPTNLGASVVDLEADPAIYAAATNPFRVLADLAAVGPAAGGAVQAATDPLARELVATPHQFGVVVASFILDQLAPESMAGALAAFEHLLGLPVALNPDHVTDSPLLVLASPEHSPIQGSFLDRTLQRKGGYTVVRHETLTHELTPAGRARLLVDVGRETVTAIEQMISKPFHLAIYAKTGVTDLTALRAIKPKFWQLRMGRPERQSNGISTSRLPLNARHLLALDVLPSLAPARDFSVHGSAVVSREMILDEERYRRFESALAALIHGRAYLTRDQQAQLDAVLELWDGGAAFLSENQAQFVMEAPSRPVAGLRRDRIVQQYPHLEAQVYQQLSATLAQMDQERMHLEASLSRMHHGLTTADERSVEQTMARRHREILAREFSLWDLYQMEEASRRARQLPTVFDETRSGPLIARLNRFAEREGRLPGHGEPGYRFLLTRILNRPLSEWPTGMSEPLRKLVGEKVAVTAAWIRPLVRCNDFVEETGHLPQHSDDAAAYQYWMNLAKTKAEDEWPLEMSPSVRQLLREQVKIIRDRAARRATTGRLDRPLVRCNKAVETSGHLPAEREDEGAYNFWLALSKKNETEWPPNLSPASKECLREQARILREKAAKRTRHSDGPLVRCNKFVQEKGRLPNEHEDAGAYNYCLKLTNVDESEWPQELSPSLRECVRKLLEVLRGKRAKRSPDKHPLARCNRIVRETGQLPLPASGDKLAYGYWVKLAHKPKGKWPTEMSPELRELVSRQAEVLQSAAAKRAAKESPLAQCNAIVKATGKLPTFSQRSAYQFAYKLAKKPESEWPAAMDPLLRQLLKARKRSRHE